MKRNAYSSRIIRRRCAAWIIVHAFLTVLFLSGSCCGAETPKVNLPFPIEDLVNEVPQTISGILKGTPVPAATDETSGNCRLVSPDPPSHHSKTPGNGPSVILCSALPVSVSFAHPLVFFCSSSDVVTSIRYIISFLHDQDGLKS